MIKNILANFIGRFWSILSNFLFIPLYIHYLGFQSYSIISFTLVIAGLMAVLDAGLTSTLSREFARFPNNNGEKIKIFMTLESSYFILIGISIILVFSLSGVIANNWLNLSTFDPNRVSFFLKIISFDVGFQLLFRFYMGGLLGLEKQVKANLYQVGWGVLRNGLVVIAILIVPTLEMFFIWQTVSTIIFAILIGLSLRKEMMSQHKFGFQLKIEKSVFKGIWRFAGGMLLISLVASLNTQMDKLAISKLLPVESLGYYTLAVSLSMGIVVLINPISTATLPRFTALYAAEKNSEASTLYSKINLGVSILVFSIMANMIFFSKELIWIWTSNSQIANNASVYLPYMAFSFAMIALQMIPFNVAIANGYTKLNNILGIFSLFLTLPGYWFITKYYGAIGAAALYCIVQSVLTIIYIYIINKKFINLIGFNFLYFKQIILPLIISLFVAFGFSLVTGWTSNGRLLSLLWIGTATISTLIFTSLVLLPRSDIQASINRIKKFKKRQN